VQYIATKAGIAGSESIMIGSELAKLRGKAWEEAALGTTIFARVLPEQKEQLVKTFQKHGMFTGMVGDGVNDALALKKADLGVAMYAGAAASRRVSDVILLNNSFTSLPLGMKLGNRIMQAIELIAVLFFHKIIFGVILLFSTLALGMLYPFAPRHVTFMNIFLVTMPTLMWTLFPPNPQHRVNPHYFWRDTLKATAPIAVLSGVTVAFTYWSVEKWYPGNHLDGVTMVIIVATFFGMYLVFLASKMLAVVYNRSARIALLLYIVSAGIVGVLSFGFTPLRDFFDFTQPNWGRLFPALALIVIVAALQYRLAVRAGDRLRQKNGNV
jgi:cation-transporting ATPase E